MKINHTITLILTVLLCAIILPILPASAGSTIDIDGIIYWIITDFHIGTDGTVLVHTCDEDITELVIPEKAIDFDHKRYTVTEIAERAFVDNKVITSVTIPNTVKTIGNEAFSNCSSLTDVIIYYDGEKPSIEPDAFVNTPVAEGGITYIDINSPYVGEVILAEGEYTKDGKTKTSGVPDDNYAYFSEGVLILNNFNYEGGLTDDKFISCKKSLKLRLLGENKLTVNLSGSGSPALIGSNGELEIYGGGSLDLTVDMSGGDAVVFKSVYSTNSITVENVALRVSSVNEVPYHHYGEDMYSSEIIIKDADLEFNSAFNGISAHNELKISGSTVAVTSRNATPLSGGAKLSIEGSFVNARGKNYPLSTFNGGEISLGNGHYILECINQTGGIYNNRSTVAFPESDYFYRTGKDAALTEGAYTHGGESYLELFTEEYQIPVEIEWPKDSFTHNGRAHTVSAELTNKAADHDAELVLEGNSESSVGDYRAKAVGLTGKDALRYTLKGGTGITHDWSINAAPMKKKQSGGGSGVVIKVWTNPYTDVDEGSWYFSAVKDASRSGLINGITATAFAPDSPITRGMFVTILCRAEGEPAAPKLNFADVAPNAYYAAPIAWASANGIVKGMTDTEFAPDDLITREQMAVILYRYAQYKGMSVYEAAERLAGFADSEDISEYAISALNWAVGKNIISGRADGTIAPGGNATRAEAAAVLMRFIG